MSLLDMINLLESDDSSTLKPPQIRRATIIERELRYKHDARGYNDLTNGGCSSVCFLSRLGGLPPDWPHAHAAFHHSATAYWLYTPPHKLISFFFAHMYF